MSEAVPEPETWITHPWVAEGQRAYPLILAETRASVQARIDAIPSATKAFIQTSLVAGTPEDAIAYYRALAAAGIQYFFPTLLRLDGETLELLADRVVPAVVTP